MARAKGKLKATTRKKPIKAGSTDKTHGGFPTQKAILIRSAIIANLKKKGNG